MERSLFSRSLATSTHFGAGWLGGRRWGKLRLASIFGTKQKPRPLGGSKTWISQFRTLVLRRYSLQSPKVDLLFGSAQGSGNQGINQTISSDHMNAQERIGVPAWKRGKRPPGCNVPEKHHAGPRDIFPDVFLSPPRPEQQPLYQYHHVKNNAEVPRSNHVVASTLTQVVLGEQSLRKTRKGVEVGHTRV